MQSKPLGLIILILCVGVIGVSTAAIFIRLCFQVAGESGFGFSFLIAASRLLLASLIVLPLVSKTPQVAVTKQAYQFAIAAGVALSLHFASWISSLAFTSIAASTTIVTTKPIWVAILSWLWLQQRLTRLTLIGIIIALLGGMGIALGDANTLQGGSNPLLGDSLALFGAWSASLYFLLGKQAQALGLSIGHYSAIAYTVAALLLFPLPFLFETTYWGYPFQIYLYLLGMALFSQVFGHTSFNWAMRWISPTLVTLMLLFEPVGASVLGFFVFGEIPSQFVFIGGIFVLIGVAIAIVGDRQFRQSDT